MVAVDEFDATKTFDLTANGFKIAFGVNNFATQLPLDDPNYVQWVVKLTQGKN